MLAACHEAGVDLASCSMKLRGSQDAVGSLGDSVLLGGAIVPGCAGSKSSC